MNSSLSNSNGNDGGNSSGDGDEAALIDSFFLPGGILDPVQLEEEEEDDDDDERHRAGSTTENSHSVKHHPPPPPPPLSLQPQIEPQLESSFWSDGPAQAQQPYSEPWQHVNVNVAAPVPESLFGDHPHAFLQRQSSSEMDQHRHSNVSSLFAYNNTCRSNVAVATDDTSSAEYGNGGPIAPTLSLAAAGPLSATVPPPPELLDPLLATKSQEAKDKEEEVRQMILALSSSLNNSAEFDLTDYHHHPSLHHLVHSPPKIVRRSSASAPTSIPLELPDRGGDYVSATSSLSSDSGGSTSQPTAYHHQHSSSFSRGEHLFPAPPPGFEAAHLEQYRNEYAQMEEVAETTTLTELELEQFCNAGEQEQGLVLQEPLHVSLTDLQCNAPPSKAESRPNETTANDQSQIFAREKPKSEGKLKTKETTRKQQQENQSKPQPTQQNKTNIDRKQKQTKSRSTKSNDDPRSQTRKKPEPKVRQASPPQQQDQKQPRLAKQQATVTGSTKAGTTTTTTTKETKYVAPKLKAKQETEKKQMAAAKTVTPSPAKTKQSSRRAVKDAKAPSSPSTTNQTSPLTKNTASRGLQPQFVAIDGNRSEPSTQKKFLTVPLVRETAIPVAPKVQPTIPSEQSDRSIHNVSSNRNIHLLQSDRNTQSGDRTHSNGKDNHPRHDNIGDNIPIQHVSVSPNYLSRIHSDTLIKLVELCQRITHFVVFIFSCMVLAAAKEAMEQPHIATQYLLLYVTPPLSHLVMSYFVYVPHFFPGITLGAALVWICQPRDLPLSPGINNESSQKKKTVKSSKKNSTDISSGTNTFRALELHSYEENLCQHSLSIAQWILPLIAVAVAMVDTVPESQTRLLTAYGISLLITKNLLSPLAWVAGSVQWLLTILGTGHKHGIEFLVTCLGFATLRFLRVGPRTSNSIPLDGTTAKRKYK